MPDCVYRAIGTVGNRANKDGNAIRAVRLKRQFLKRFTILRFLDRPLDVLVRYGVRFRLVHETP